MFFDQLRPGPSSFGIRGVFDQLGPGPSPIGAYIDARC